MFDCVATGNVRVTIRWKTKDGVRRIQLILLQGNGFKMLDVMSAVLRSNRDLLFFTITC